MQLPTPESHIKHAVAINWSDRWQLYQRLQELEIPSWCQTNQLLTVEITNSTAAIQLWSVVRRFLAPRQELICHLHRCWRQDF